VVFSRYSVFLHDKTDHHKITEILLKVALNTIILTPNPEMEKKSEKLSLDMHSATSNYINT
jgi:hypothetical protein